MDSLLRLRGCEFCGVGLLFNMSNGVMNKTLSGCGLVSIVNWFGIWILLFNINMGF